MASALPVSHRMRGGWATLDPGALLAGGFLLWLLGASAFPALFAHADPLAIAPVSAFQAPSPDHIFGTDQCGRDLASRIVHGARLSLLIGTGSTCLALLIAVPVALLGGLGGRRVKTVVERGLEIQFSFPVLIFALLFSAHLSGGVGPLVVTMGIGMSAGFAKTILASIVAVRGSHYIEAARGLGHSPQGIVIRHILPNAFRPLVVMATMGVGHAVAWASSLSFLGLGVSQPAPEWGTMLAMSRDFITRAWWLTLFPGLFIVATTIATTVIGRWLQYRMERREA